MNSDEQLTFALAQAEFWRLKYLKAAENEREACAKVAEDAEFMEGGVIADAIAKAIRARGEHDRP